MTTPCVGGALGGAGGRRLRRRRGGESLFGRGDHPNALVHKVLGPFLVIRRVRKELVHLASPKTRNPRWPVRDPRSASDTPAHSHCGFLGAPAQTLSPIRP